ARRLNSATVLGASSSKKRSTMVPAPVSRTATSSPSAGGEAGVAGGAAAGGGGGASWAGGLSGHAGATPRTANATSRKKSFMGPPPSDLPAAPAPTREPEIQEACATRRAQFLAAPAAPSHSLSMEPSRVASPSRDLRR